MDIFLEHMGLQEHQVIYGLHQNTNNYHVHIAVNRVHPYTLKVIRPNNGFDIEAAHKIVALIERKQGWASEDNTRYTVLENGEVIRAWRKNKIQPRTEAQDFERATGEKSAQRIAQERAYEIIKNAESWQELHQKLAEKSLRFERKGSGAIIFVGDIAIKASSVDRAFGMSKLCKKLGDFVPASVPEIEEKIDIVALDLRKTRSSPNANATRPSGRTPPRTIAPEPVSDVNLNEWRQYQAERTAARQEKSDTGEQTLLQALKIQQREERKRVLPTLAKHGLHILNIARHFLMVKQREEQQQVRQKARPNNTTAAYFAHFENIRKHLTVEDFSRVDAMIAIRLRASGHSPQAVADTILQCAPTIRQGHEKREGRDWYRYTERTAAYAFGVAGDIALTKNEKYFEHWRKIEGMEQEVRQKVQQEIPRMRMR